MAVLSGDVLVVNAGSTSLKLSLVSTDERSSRIASLQDVPSGVGAVAHRIVHGGARFVAPVVVDGEVLAALSELTELAPLHNAPALEALGQARRALPGVPHVAVFDTAFHATLAPAAFTYPLPRGWREEWGIRRFGFHGLSVAWAASRVRVPRLVVAHLGGGCSLTAVRGGRSVDTTMGFSPLDGVPMVTRSGGLDPEILLHVLRKGLLSVEELDGALEQASGLAGMSGLSGRVDELERAAADGDADARLALDVFARRVAQAVAAMATALGGLDALVFTAGIGERSAGVRSDVCGLLGFLGVTLDAQRNAQAQPDAELAAVGAPVRIVLLRAREDIVAARAARTLLAQCRSRGCRLTARASR